MRRVWTTHPCQNTPPSSLLSSTGKVAEFLQWESPSAVLNLECLLVPQADHTTGCSLFLFRRKSMLQPHSASPTARSSLARPNPVNIRPLCLGPELRLSSMPHMSDLQSSGLQMGFLLHSSTRLLLLTSQLLPVERHLPAAPPQPPAEGSAQAPSWLGGIWNRKHSAQQTLCTLRS